MKKRKVHSLLVLSLLNLFGISEVKAVIIGSVVGNTDGSFTYTYTVNNTAGLFAVAAFSLEFDFVAAERDWNPEDLLLGGDVTTNLGDPLAPLDDWTADAGIPFSGLSAQDFFAVGPLGEGDVLIGETLGGFSFTSNFAPGQVTATGFGPAGESTVSQTIGPAVPEPTSVALLGLASAFLFRRRRLA